MVRGRRSRRVAPTRRYPRTARLDELCREIVADELERIDDERLDLVTVTHVHVDPDLRRALVEFSALPAILSSGAGPSGGRAGAEQVGVVDAAVVEALGEHRIRLQAAIGRQARLKRTPELRFAPDPVVRHGARIDAILRDVVTDDDVPEAAGGEPSPDAGGGDGGRP